MNRVDLRSVKRLAGAVFMMLQCLSGLAAAQNEVQVLASGLRAPGRLTLDATSIYFRDDADGSIKKISKNGGSITLLAAGLTDQADLNDLVVFGDTLYFVDEGFEGYEAGRLMSVSTSGGSLSVLATGLTFPRTLAVDQSGIYVAESFGGVLKYDFTGNQLSVLADNLAISRLAHDATNLYVLDQAGSFSPLIAIPKAGGVGVVLDGSGGYGSDVVTDGTDVYYSSTNVALIELRRTAKDGSATTTLVSRPLGDQYTGTLAVDESFVYFGNGEVRNISIPGPHFLKKVPKDGGPVTILATLNTVSDCEIDFPELVSAIAVDDFAVYWTEYAWPSLYSSGCGAWPPPPLGALKKLVKAFETPLGSSVVVQAGSRVSVTFSSITSAGTTSIVPLDSTATGNFSLSENLGAYEITTTATYSGPITTCFTVSDISDETAFNNLMVFHVENGAPVNVTSSHDFATRRVCGTTTSLSPFAVVKGPADQIDDLVALVKRENLRSGIENSLDAKLENAQRAVTAARSNDRVTACGVLDAFVSEVQAQTDKGITPAQATRLIAAAREIQTLLACH